MVSIFHSYLLISLSVLFQKTSLVNPLEIKYLSEGKTINANNANNQDSDTDRKENYNHIENRKFKRNGGWISNAHVANGLTIVIPEYKLRYNETICLSLTVDAIISFKYYIHQIMQARDIYVPSYAEVTGNCSSENEQYIALNWLKFVLTWYFIKVPDKGRWFLSKVELTLNPSDLFYEIVEIEDDYYTLGSSNNDPIFEAPIGNMFGCSKEIEVNLSSLQINMVASLYMRTLIVKPFTEGSEYEKAYVCMATKCRSELLIVGCIFLAVVLNVKRYA